MPPVDFTQQLKEQTDIVRIIGDYVRLKKAGAQNWQGLCPFHQEKTASFSVHQTRQFYHCFGCGKSGDVFQFVKEIENVTFPESVRMVAQKMGIQLPKQQFSPQEAAEAQQRGALLEMHDRAAEWFQQQLHSPEGARAREYLSQQRGLDENTIKAFRIGYAPESGFHLRDRFIKNAQFNEEQLKLSGLFKWKDETGGVNALYPTFRNRVLFPIANEAGRIIAFTGRTLSNDDKSGPKYLNSPETPIYTKGRVLFNLDKAKDAIRKLDYAIVVEGNVDCITVYASGFQNVIATSGTAFSEVQVRLLGRFSKNIVVNFDPDNAGANATEKSLALLLEEEFNVRILTLDAGFDPDLYIRRRGKEAYAQALKASLPYTDYLIERARALFPQRTADAKVKAVNWLLPHIQRIPNRIKRDELAMDAAQKLGIDSTTLRQELKQAAVTRATRQVTAQAVGAITDSEKVLLRALAPGVPAEFFETQQHLREAMAHELLQEGLGTESLFTVLLANPEAQHVTDLPLEDDARRVLASVLMESSAGDDFNVELLRHSVMALRRMHLEREQRRLGAELSSAERQNDVAEMARLVRQKMKVSRELRDL
ncbi:MAG: DNA primase [Acidobacteriaceae bacterium]